MLLVIQLFKPMSKPSYLSRYSIPRVPPGLTADAIAAAIAAATPAATPAATAAATPAATAVALRQCDIRVQLVPAKPMFCYGGVQHAALITISDLREADSDFVHDLKVVHDLEAQLYFTLQKLNGENRDVAKWRWALRGLVIQ